MVWRGGPWKQASGEEVFCSESHAFTQGPNSTVPTQTGHTEFMELLCAPSLMGTCWGQQDTTTHPQRGGYKRPWSSVLVHFLFPESKHERETTQARCTTRSDYLESPKSTQRGTGVRKPQHPVLEVTSKMPGPVLISSRTQRQTLPAPYFYTEFWAVTEVLESRLSC